MAPGTSPSFRDGRGEKIGWDPCPLGGTFLLWETVGRQTPPGPFLAVTRTVGETSRAEWGQATFHQDAVQALSEKAALELDLKVGISKSCKVKSQPQSQAGRGTEN